MPVNTTKSSKTFQGNGVTQTWSCDFRIFAATDVTVAVIDQVAGTSTPLSLGSDFTVSGANDDGGFTVNTTLPIASGKNLLVKRVIAFTQPTSFTNQGRFFPTLHQDMADRLEMQIQQINDTQGRFLQFPDGVLPEPDGELPIPQPSSILGWSEDGTKLVNTGPTGVGAGQLTDVNINSNAGINASKLSFIGSFGGAVLRTVLAKLRNLRVNLEDYSTLIQATAASKTVQISTSATGGGATLATASVADATFRGEGSLTGLYRKAVIPDNASSDGYFSVDIVPAKHLKQLNLVQKPTVVLIGDSISTYFANSIARGDMLNEVLRSTLDRQFPRGIKYFNRSIAGQTLQGTFGTVAQNAYPWATASGKVWIDYVKDLTPDLIVVSFGMNDSVSASINTLKNFLTYVQTWPKVPSIVFATNLVPNPSSTAFPEGEAGNAGRDLAAGLTRSFAKFNGLGVLDVHRKVCMVRDGFDPGSSCITRGDTVSAVAGSGGSTSCTGTRTCRDFKVRIGCTPTSITASTQYILVKYGAGANDFLQIFRPTSTTVQIAMYAGHTDSSAINSVNFNLTPAGGNYVPFTIEVSNDVLNIYDDNTNLGQNTDPYLSVPIVRCGGEFVPVVSSNAGNILYACDFSYGEYRINVPSVRNSLLWGDGTSAIDVHGGSGWNHPGGFAATHVYRPLIEGAKWCEPQTVTGSAPVASGSLNLTVAFPTAEETNDYNIFGSWAAGNAPVWGINSKTTTGFTISFPAATTAATTFYWSLARK